MLNCGSEFVVGGKTMAFATETSSVSCIKAELFEIESLKNDPLWRQCMIQEPRAALEPPCAVAATESEVNLTDFEEQEKTSRNEQR